MSNKGPNSKNAKIPGKGMTFIKDRAIMSSAVEQMDTQKASAIMPKMTKMELDKDISCNHCLGKNNCNPLLSIDPIMIKGNRRKVSSCNLPKNPMSFDSDFTRVNCFHGGNASVRP